MGTMTEQQIKDGFDQLAGALAPPPDAPDRVDRLVRVRRRRRRTGIAGAVALGVAAVAGYVAVGMGGDNGTDTPVAVDAPSGLTMTRADGSTYTFSDVTVSCDPPVANGEALERGRADRIWAYSPIAFNEEGGEESLDAPFVLLEGVVSKLQQEPELEVPFDAPQDTGRGALVLFAADTEGGKPGDPGNEVASSAGGSGTIRVLEATCDPVPVLRIEVDATLGSEEGKESLEFAGRLP
jgi:hypothetical protein